MQTVKMYLVRNLGQLYLHAIETANVMAAHCVYITNTTRIFDPFIMQK